MLTLALSGLKELALGGTAVGTGLNCPTGFDGEGGRRRCPKITGKQFVTAENKFHALTSKDDLVFAHGALKALAGEHDEDRQRRTLAGQRPAGTVWARFTFPKTSPVPPSCPAR